MKEYYLVQGDEKQGPFSLEELKNQKLFSHTLIWKEGWGDWQEASQIASLQEFIRQSPPPIPRGISSGSTDYNYSQIEDIAGVDYKKAMIVTGIYIAFQLFAREYAIGFLGILASTALACFIWYYFKKYFDASKDSLTSKWINWIIGAYILLGLINLYSITVGWTYDIFVVLGEIWRGETSEASDAMGTKVAILQMGVFIGLLAVFISGLKVIQANRKHPFPLKRIAISAMIFVPFSMILNLVENIMYSEGYIKESEIPPFFMAIFLLPYYFLLYHFYRADKDDATPT